MYGGLGKEVEMERSSPKDMCVDSRSIDRVGLIDKS